MCWKIFARLGICAPDFQVEERERKEGGKKRNSSSQIPFTPPDPSTKKCPFQDNECIFCFRITMVVEGFSPSLTEKGGRRFASGLLSPFPVAITRRTMFPRRAVDTTRGLVGFASSTPTPKSCVGEGHINGRKCVKLAHF